MNMKQLISVVICIVAFGGCQSKQDKAETPSQPQGPTAVDYVFEQGELITDFATNTLGGALKKALQEGGVASAIPYCNVSALPLLDSISTQYEVSIRRTTRRIRNPLDSATVEERRHLNIYEDQIANEQELVPQVEALANGTFLYTRPIVLAAMCQSCHGEVGQDIKPEDYALIQEHYPDDQAINYAAGDLRGMWSVSFDIEAVLAAMEATDTNP